MLLQGWQTFLWEIMDLAHLKNPIQDNINYCIFAYLNKMELQRYKMFIKWSYSQWHQDISGDISGCMLFHSTVLSPTYHCGNRLLLLKDKFAGTKKLL